MPNFSDLQNARVFSERHIGPNVADQQKMLAALGYDDLDTFIKAVVPADIRNKEDVVLPEPLSETDALAELKDLLASNKVFKSFIGQGYYGTHTPLVVQRNILENPAWYTAYTPYQPEISQGRLEALLNFQTMVSDLTGMDIANASMLDEGTAAAEAMTLCKRMSKSKSDVFFVDKECLPQTIDIVVTRAEPLDIEVVVADISEIDQHEPFGALLQYPGASGQIQDFSQVVEQVHAQKGLVIFAADLLSLMLLKSPGELGADVTVGNTQRFGVPMGFGGPHAGYMATKEAFKRSLPGRLVGESIDAQGQPALRLALQTREQHIRREKATSNICTAQVLLAIIASMYAVYHGPKGLKDIAQRVHALTTLLANELKGKGIELVNSSWFDTLTLNTGANTADIIARAEAAEFNLRQIDGASIGIALDETTTLDDVAKLLEIVTGESVQLDASSEAAGSLAADLLRTDAVLTHEVFNRYHCETEMLRYLRKLSDKDIALDRAMIPLGSCTMKLNATAEMTPVTWPEINSIHPFAPQNQSEGYRKMITQLEDMLCKVTGYDAVSLQPNAGSQGEFAGLLAIRAYHESRGDMDRNICLIPSSAHGTNPASAHMCGMKVVVVKCDNNGNVDLDDLREKAEKHSAQLAAIMVTYPSTHGVFEEGIGELSEIVHSHGGQVYVDGANLNAMVGLCQPGKFGGDVSHLNLHKTFCIPHGGGGPGVGPVAVGKHLEPFLPGHKELGKTELAVSAAPFGSASILPISWMYMRMMGAESLKNASEIAILSANYIAKRLGEKYPVLYTGAEGLVAHECILDLRPIKASSGISVDDVAKRLIDFGFHAPTMSFPVAGTLMIEPTESEAIEEVDRFCDAMLAIHDEIMQVENGAFPADDNPLVNAPHTAEVVTGDEWPHAYTRSQAAYPFDSLRASKYWVPVGRLDNVYGDKNLVCSCAPISAYE